MATTPAQDVFKEARERIRELLESSPEMQALMPIAAVKQRNRQPGLRTIDIVENVCAAYADRQALGTRDYELVPNEAGRLETKLLPTYSTFSYRELQARYRGLATSWANAGDAAVRRGDFVCILGFASADFVVVDLACLHAGAVSVPLQTNMHADDLARIVAETQPRCVVASIDNIERAVAAILSNGSVPSLVVIDYEQRDERQHERYCAAQTALEGSGTVLVPVSDLIAHGRTLPAVPTNLPEPGKDPLATIFYTSGSTGSPKGAMWPDDLLRRLWAADGLAVPTVSLSYLPFNHTLGRVTVIRTLSNGGVCYFAAHSDMSTLFEDMQRVRPTVLEMVPRIIEMIYDHFLAEVARVRSQGNTDEDHIRSVVMRDMRAHFLGGRLAIAGIGSAPSSAEVRDFIRECFGITLFEGYGSTEVGSVTFNGNILKDVVSDYKLIDVPELGYFSTDRPFPRGELLVKSATVISGYFKQPEASRDLIDAEGFVHTGDIVELRAPDNIGIVDRRNTVLKLAQGEFVAITQLEPQFTSQERLLRHVYLYGNSKRSFLLAVVVPDIDVARERLGREPQDDELRQLVRAAINAAALAQGLRSYEIPRDFIIEKEPFTNANGLLSSVGKPLRPNLKAQFGDALEALYAVIEDNQRQKLENLRREDSRATVRERVVCGLEAVLGLSDVDLSARPTFTELGGDSLACVSFSILLEDIFGFPVPVGTILNPGSDLLALTETIEARANRGKAELTSYASVHGALATEVFARDLVLDKVIAPETLAAADAAAPVRSAIRTVLVTGATGFLGRFLCLSWLEEIAKTGGKVVAIIRASDDKAAFARLERAFGTADPALAEHFARLAASHLEVLAGDLTVHGFGLADEVYARLADEVDLVVHPAAQVNHILPYRQLFEPNVLGTANIIAFALSRRLKRIDNISTVAVALRADAPPLGEDEDVRLALPSHRISESYANGYGLSKWAGEVMLRDARDQFGLSINIFRPGMIMPHSGYAGQINLPDVFARMLLSIARTGLAPSSFHPQVEGGRPHYDGLPVDFIARAIVAIRAAGDNGFATYNVSNPHDDATLDQFMDALEQSGFVIERIGDYADWVRRLEMALQALPEGERQQSSLPVIEQLRHSAPSEGMLKLDCRNFRSRVIALGLDQSGDIPHLDHAYILKCVADLRVLGLAEPGRSMQLIA